MQHRLTNPHPLLDAQSGCLLEAGYANDFLLEYNKAAIADAKRTKEWEYFLALKKEYGIGVTLADIGTVSMFSLHLIDLQHRRHICKSIMRPGRMEMPLGVEQSVSFTQPDNWCRYEKEGANCVISFHMERFGEVGVPISGELTFTTPPGDKMVLVLPYQDPGKFYYNYKVNCMPVRGRVCYGEEIYSFDENTGGTQDWGRGIWEPVNQWYWGSASTELGGKPFGFNIGHGFGDISRATENMIFYDGVCHKLDKGTFRIEGDVIGDLRLVLPDENYLKPWKFISSDGRLDLDFQPVLDRQSGEQKGEFFSTQHQVFGYYSGKAILDDGRALQIDRLLGFAEKVGNDWRMLEP